MKRRESSPLSDIPSSGVLLACDMSDPGRSDKHLSSPSQIIAEVTEQVDEGDINSQESASKRQKLSTESPSKVPLSVRRRTSNGRPSNLNTTTPSCSEPTFTSHTTTPSPTSPSPKYPISPTSSTATVQSIPRVPIALTIPIMSSNSYTPNSNGTPNNPPNTHTDIASTSHGQYTNDHHPTIQTNLPSIPLVPNFVATFPISTPATLPSSYSTTVAKQLPCNLNPDTPVLTSAATISTTPSLSLSACLDSSSIKPTNPPKSAKVSNKEDLYQHLEDIVRQYEGRDMSCKFELSAICKDLKRTEFTEFITEHFKTTQLAKDKKKDQRKRKAHPSNYHEEIRQMMHGFGDAADAHLESAKFVELLVKKFLILLVASIKAVLPDFSKPKINAEVLSVALLPDIKRVHRIQQGIQLLIQRRRLKHAEETSNGIEAPTDANAGEFENLTVEELETLSTEAHVQIPTAQPKHKLSTKDETSSTLFESPYWTTLFRKAAEQAEKDKLERHMLKDRVSQLVPTDGFAYFTQCTNASFTKPSQKKLLEFMQAHCGLQEDMEMTSKVVEMVGLLAYDFAMEIVAGILKKRNDLKIPISGIEPLHLATFVSSFSAV